MVEQSYLFSPLSSGYSKFLNIFDSTELEKVFDLQKKPPSLTLPTVQYGEKAQRLDDFNVPLETGFLHLLEENFTPKLDSPLFVKNVPIVQEPTIEDDVSRFWKVFLKSGYEENQVELSWKTRNQSFTTALPDKMYSSLKYEFKVKLTSESLKLPFILARIYILEEEINEIQKEVLTGVIECAMSKELSGYSGSLRVQMSHNLAFYHSKRSFYFQVRFYDPQEVLIDKNFASISSPSFKIYARKPNSKDPEKKRKQNHSSNSVKKVKSSSNDFSDFTLCLDNLIKVNSKLNKEEKKLALDMVINKFKQQDSESFQKALEENL